MHPVCITLSKEKRALAITWNNGETVNIPAAILLQHCRSAGALRQYLDGSAGPMAAAVTIEAVRLIGRYAINIVFSNGQERGIYPWQFLAEIAAGLPPQFTQPRQQHTLENAR